MPTVDLGPCDCCGGDVRCCPAGIPANVVLSLSSAAAACSCASSQSYPLTWDAANCVWRSGSVTYCGCPVEFLFYLFTDAFAAADPSLACKGRLSWYNTTGCCADNFSFPPPGCDDHAWTFLQHATSVTSCTPFVASGGVTLGNSGLCPCPASSSATVNWTITE